MKHCQLKKCRFETETPDARYCANDGSELGSESYRSEFRKTLGVIGRDVSGLVGKVAGGVGRVGLKVVLYPTAGNLSRNLQERLEGVLGKERYDGVVARDFSEMANTLLYSGITFAKFYDSGDDVILNIFGGLTIGFIATFAEMKFRDRVDESKREQEAEKMVTKELGREFDYMNNPRSKANEEWKARGRELYQLTKARPVGSLLGKLVSLPIEAGLAVYGSAKNYLINCKNRAVVQEEGR